MFVWQTHQQTGRYQLKFLVNVDILSSFLCFRYNVLRRLLPLTSLLFACCMLKKKPSLMVVTAVVLVVVGCITAGETCLVLLVQTVYASCRTVTVQPKIMHAQEVLFASTSRTNFLRQIVDTYAWVLRTPRTSLQGLRL